MYIILAGITKFSSNNSNTLSDSIRIIKQKHEAEQEGVSKSFVGAESENRLSFGNITTHNQQRESINAVALAVKAYENEQNTNLNKVDPFEHIRLISLNKIKIANVRQWDIAKYD